MDLQQTLREPVTVLGVEPYGGKTVEVRISPANENTGILFQTKKGDVRADVMYASQSQSAILLDNGQAQVLHVEHFLATLYAYEIDNALVELKTIPSLSFRMMGPFASDIPVLPTVLGREKPLCERIEQVGIEVQQRERKTYRVTEMFGNEKLSLKPIPEGLKIRATTVYDIPGEETFELELTPENYKDQVSESRSFVKHLPYGLHKLPFWLLSAGVSVANPRYGIGHGISKDLFFFPPRDLKEWRGQEIYPAEIARHTIVDRLGALALLGTRLEGAYIQARFSGHQHDIDLLREYKRNIVSAQSKALKGVLKS